MPGSVSVPAADAAAGVAPGDVIAVTLPLSEPLDEEDRPRVEEAFRQLPANDVVAGPRQAGMETVALGIMGVSHPTTRRSGCSTPPSHLTRR